MKQQLLGFLALIALAILAAISFGWAIHHSFFASTGGIDFHSYWYAGLFVRQRADPYSAYLSGSNPETPISFLDRSILEEVPQAEGLATTPANTAPIVLLLTPLSWVPWPVARPAWFVLNSMLALIIPWLVVRLLPVSSPLPWLVLLLFCFSFYAFKSTRIALATGQTTLLVFALMLICVCVWDKRWLLAGILLGIALSKYSVALPFLLYAVYKRQFKVVASAIAIQALGILAIWAFSGSTPLSIVQSYYQILQAHAALPGIHLAELFKPGSPGRVLAPMALTIAVWGILAWLLVRAPHRSRRTGQEEFRDFHVLTVLSLWTLLIAYHRPYDAVLAIIFVALLMYGLNAPVNWQLTQPQQWSLALFLVFAIVVLIAPSIQTSPNSASGLLNSLFATMPKVASLTLVAMLGVSLWLLYRISWAD